MRNIIICLILITVSQTLAQAQPFVDSPSGNGAIHYSGGNVGIGEANPSSRFQIADNQLSIYTSSEQSNGWTKDGLTISANPDVNYSSVRINSNHSPVNDRGVLNVTRSTNSLFYVRTDGKVGVGTTNPKGRLHVQDHHIDIFTSESLSNGWTKDGLTISANPDVNYSSVRINSNHSAVNNRGVLNVTRSANSLFYVRTDGNVGIGTTTPDSKLTVAGKIHSQEVQVTVDAGADFVFEEDYSLTSLEELDEYVKENKHLPEIASAKEMESEGIHLAEMNIKLLQKVEELTLHLIEMNKEIELLKSKVK